MTKFLPVAFGLAVFALAPQTASAQNCNDAGGRRPCAVTVSKPKLAPVAARARGEVHRPAAVHHAAARHGRRR